MFEYDRETLLHFEEDRRQSKIGEAPRKSFYKAVGFVLLGII